MHSYAVANIVNLPTVLLQLVESACPFAALTGIAPEKMHSLKDHCLWLLSHPISLFFLPPLFVLEILMLEIPSCSASGIHPSYPRVQHSNLRR